jgi:hypothetical protein
LNAGNLVSKFIFYLFKIILISYVCFKVKQIKSDRQRFCQKRTCSSIKVKYVNDLLCCPKNFGGASGPRVVRPSVSPSVHTNVQNSCPAHNFVIWSGILQLLYRNDHHIETTCRTNIWVSTLKVKVLAWPWNKIVSGPYFRYLKSDFILFHRNDHHNKTTCRAQHFGRYLEGEGHSMTLQQTYVRPITLLLEVGFYSMSI